MGAYFPIPPFFESSSERKPQEIRKNMVDLNKILYIIFIKLEIQNLTKLYIYIIYFNGIP